MYMHFHRIHEIDLRLTDGRLLPRRVVAHFHSGWKQKRNSFTLLRRRRSFALCLACTSGRSNVLTSICALYVYMVCWLGRREKYKKSSLYFSRSMPNPATPINIQRRANFVLQITSFIVIVAHLFLNFYDEA